MSTCRMRRMCKKCIQNVDQSFRNELIISVFRPILAAAQAAVEDLLAEEAEKKRKKAEANAVA